MSEVYGLMSESQIVDSGKGGKLIFSLAEGEEKILYFIYFEVRSPEENRNILALNEKGAISN
jgi:hypothetical protein